MQALVLLSGAMGLTALIFQPNRRTRVPPEELNTAYPHFVTPGFTELVYSTSYWMMILQIYSWGVLKLRDLNYVRKISSIEVDVLCDLTA